MSCGCVLTRYWSHPVVNRFFFCRVRAGRTVRHEKEEDFLAPMVWTMTGTILFNAPAKSSPISNATSNTISCEPPKVCINMCSLKLRQLILTVVYVFVLVACIAQENDIINSKHSTFKPKVGRSCTVSSMSDGPEALHYSSLRMSIEGPNGIYIYIYIWT